MSESVALNIDVGQYVGTAGTYEDPMEFVRFQQELQKIDRNELRNLGRESLAEQFYVSLIERFVQTGSYPPEASGDPICDYLISVMSDAELRLIVLTDSVRARIFQDSMMRFVDSALKRKRFNIACKQSEMRTVQSTLQWAPEKKADGWQALLEMLDQRYSQYGFRTAYFRKMFSNPDNMDNQPLWESLYKEYLNALQQQLRQQQSDMIQKEGALANKETERNLECIPDYMNRNNISEEEFRQAWNMMGGMWYERDFARYVRLARRQKEYPALHKIAARMGRVLDNSGDTAMWIGSGRKLQMQHSTKSDIHGVTISRQLHAMLPLEQVQMLDEDLEDVFLVKYSSAQLQCFLNKSEQINPNKRAERRRARHKGPMIACVDTSGSMRGEPEMIANSLILKLVDMAREQKRDLYIIAFSVSAKPIDARREHNRLLEFFAKQSSGDTNGEKMMRLVLDQLSGAGEYMNADVVIIGDFRMPPLPAPMQDAIQSHIAQGTRFYGLQLGGLPESENAWLPLLTQHYTIGYDLMRRY